MFYSSDAEATRAFLRDVLQLPARDVGEGWLIFQIPESDMGVHPAEGGAKPGTHDISFYCDDVEKTVQELKSKGVEFPEPVQDQGWGIVTTMLVPGGVRVQLYQPKY